MRRLGAASGVVATKLGDQGVVSVAQKGPAVGFCRFCVNLIWESESLSTWRVVVECKKEPGVSGQKAFIKM